MKCIIFLLCFTLSLSFLKADAQHLKRRPFLGTQLAPVKDSLRKALNLENNTGMVVAEVYPGGTAFDLNLQKDDIITAINGVRIQTIQDVITTIAKQEVGQLISVEYLRSGQSSETKGKLKPSSLESDPNTDVIYDEVKVTSGYVRSIIKKPKDKNKVPAVFFIQGIGCGSIDQLSRFDMQRQLIDALVKKGYAVFRMEKPGVGDSHGTKQCTDIGYNEEKDAFLAGLRSLKKFDFIDKDNVFLFGHSLGGNTAPLIASEEKVKGIIAYGSVTKPWLEYLLDVHRDQRPLYGIDYMQVDYEMKELIPWFYEYLVLKKTPAELAADKDNPIKKRSLFDANGRFAGRHYTFLQELQEVPTAKAWKDAAAYSLGIYGEADVQALNADAAKMMADIVNRYHPGKGEYLILPGTDHSFAEVGSKQEYIKLQSSGKYMEKAKNLFSNKLVTAIDQWMKDKFNKS
ncbi:MAG TPA: alpha/beta fold hydrolase [Segetibacter sp.]|jgi:hypothetical protein